MPKNIYIVGAQCTGKTTLVTALSTYFTTTSLPETPPPLILVEVARTVLRQHALTANDITSSPSRAMRLQELIFEAQYAAEEKAAAGKQWFIADRSGFDPIVYARRYVGEEGARNLLGMGMWGVLRERMVGSLVVICEAGADWLVDDGVRLMPVDRADWRAFHDLFCEVMRAEGVGFEVLPCDVVELKERVAFVLDWWEGAG